MLKATHQHFISSPHSSSFISHLPPLCLSFPSDRSVDLPNPGCQSSPEAFIILCQSMFIKVQWSSWWQSVCFYQYIRICNKVISMPLWKGKRHLLNIPTHAAARCCHRAAHELMLLRFLLSLGCLKAWGMEMTLYQGLIFCLKGRWRIIHTKNMSYKLPSLWTFFN